MKKILSILSIVSFCLSLKAIGVLHLIQDIKPTPATAYVTQKISPNVTESVKIALLADMSLSLSDGNTEKFSQVNLDLQRSRRGQFIFPNVNCGYVASILFAIEWMNKYPNFARSREAISFMITGLLNINDDAESLETLGITNDRRVQIIDQAESLSESLSTSDRSEDEIQ